MDMWQGVKSAEGREVVAVGQILLWNHFSFHNSQLKKKQKTACTKRPSGNRSNRPSDSWVVKAILPFQELVLSFLKLSVVHIPKQTFCSVRGELMKRMSSWREFDFNPVAASPDCAYPWAHIKALSHLVGSLSLFLLDITLRSLLCAAPLNVICFVPAMGIIPSNLGMFPFPVCEVIHITTVMHYELCKPSICVLWLDPLTQARTVNGQDFCFSSFTPMWDLLSVHHRPKGPQSIYLFTTLGLHATCYFSLPVLFVFACSSLWALAL